MKITPKNISIYQKLLILFFAALIPFFTLSLVTTNIAETRLREHAEARIAAELKIDTEKNEQSFSRVHSWMTLNLMTGYRPLLANDNVTLSSYLLGQLVNELFTDLQHMTQFREDISNIAVYMPRTNRTVSLPGYYNSDISEDARQRIEVYKKENRSFLRLQGAFRIQSILTTSPTKEPLYVLEITLSDDIMLRNLNLHEESQYAVFTDHEVSLGAEDNLPLLQKACTQVYAMDTPYGQFVQDGYLISFHQFYMKNNYLVSYILLEELLAPIRSFNVFSVIALVLALIVSAVISLHLSRMIRRPFRDLSSLFRQVQEGNINASFDEKAIRHDEFFQIFVHFKAMMEKIQALIAQSVEQEKALQLAEYRNLQAHIAPHFLYNSFNVLRHSIRLGDQETAEQMALHLGSYFRYLSYMDAHEDITLREEYRHVTDYLIIQKFRFQDNIQYSIDPLPEKYCNVRIPPFCLQPLVENIFKHGMNDMACTGKIELKIIETQNSLLLIVRDNGSGMSEESLQHLRQAMNSSEKPLDHTGIVHICQRLKYYFGSECSVEVNSKHNEFFEVRITLPIKEDT